MEDKGQNTHKLRRGLEGETFVSLRIYPLMEDLLINESTLKAHLATYRDNKAEYLNMVERYFMDQVLQKSIQSANKVKVVATLLQNLDKFWLQELYPYLDLMEMTRACQMLDSNRLARQL